MAGMSWMVEGPAPLTGDFTDPARLAGCDQRGCFLRAEFDGIARAVTIRHNGGEAVRIWSRIELLEGDAAMKASIAKWLASVHDYCGEP